MMTSRVAPVNSACRAAQRSARVEPSDPSTPTTMRACPSLPDPFIALLTRSGDGTVDLGDCLWVNVNAAAALCSADDCARVTVQQRADISEPADRGCATCRLGEAAGRFHFRAHGAGRERPGPQLGGAGAGEGAGRGGAIPFPYSFDVGEQQQGVSAEFLGPQGGGEVLV